MKLFRTVSSLSRIMDARAVHLNKFKDALVFHDSEYLAVVRHRPQAVYFLDIAPFHLGNAAPKTVRY